MIWIIGEYAEKIENAADLLGTFLDAFKEESYPVQLQTLTAVVKLYLKKPEESQHVVEKVLKAATKDCDSADVRDRAYIYWRLLSTDAAVAKVRHFLLYSYSSPSSRGETYDIITLGRLGLTRLSPWCFPPDLRSAYRKPQSRLPSSRN